MYYYLMHKNIPVAILDLSMDGSLGKVSLIDQGKYHLPLGCQMNNMRFHEWWRDRSIPKTRKGANHALRQLGLPSTDSLLINNLALSLNDCYWINPSGSNLSWKG